MTTVTQSREVKQVIETGIDSLFDSVSSDAISIEDATESLRVTLNAAPSTVYSLSKRYLKRCYVVIGRANDAPKSNGTQDMKNSRENLFSYLFGDALGEENNAAAHNSGVDEDLKQDSNQPTGLSLVDEVVVDSDSPIRRSPRRAVAANRDTRATVVTSNAVLKLQERLDRMEKERIESKRTETEIVDALRSIPSMSERKSSKKSNKHRDLGRKSSARTKTNRKHGKKKRTNESDSDTSSSDSDWSESSSSTSDTSTSDSDISTSSSRSGRRGHRKYRADVPIKYARQIIKNVGRDGFVAYLNRVVATVRNSGKVVDSRSVHEATNLGAAIDAFVEDGISHKKKGMEILTTRFIGLVHVVKTGSWTFMEGIQSSVATADALPLTAKQMSKIIKTGATIAAMSTPVSKSTRTYVNSGRQYPERMNNGTTDTTSGQRTFKKKNETEKSSATGTTSYDKSGSNSK